ncbi:hypothetical protein GARC_0884 [Paraglaciecola arctica BSs20135]|uniref:Uncharacterized protein n=1 Tax=Paraglaciecola arctica BSs20135 TaxID=493475 RepID=K6Z364_9ALTE|nr:hypothetical protein GARC_0884 [Paraglaciecola arctica BSs20135]
MELPSPNGLFQPYSNNNSNDNDYQLHLVILYLLLKTNKLAIKNN